MTKKVKDLTNKEINAVCQKSIECGSTCPLYRKQEGHYRGCMLSDVKEALKEMIDNLFISNKNCEVNERVLKYRNLLREVEEDLEIEIDVED